MKAAVGVDNGKEMQIPLLRQLVSALYVPSLLKPLTIGLISLK